MLPCSTPCDSWLEDKADNSKGNFGSKSMNNLQSPKLSVDFDTMRSVIRSVTHSRANKDTCITNQGDRGTMDVI